MYHPYMLHFLYILLFPLALQAAADQPTPILPDRWSPQIEDLADPPPKPRPALFIPRRIPGAPTGRELLERTAGMSLAQREPILVEEILRGNVPSFQRQFVPVRMRVTDERRRKYRGWVFVLPDYLAVGDDVDYVHVPLTTLSAQKIASAFGAFLPTRAIVDATYAASRARLTPFVMQPAFAMRFNGYLKIHEDFLRKQLSLLKPGTLVAGHKKDTVIANRLIDHPRRTAIYGWHVTVGEPIQPLSAWHRKTYADYSHGVRLVFGSAVAQKSEWALDDLLRHPTLSQLVSDEGPLASPRIDPTEVEWDVEELRPAPVPSKKTVSPRPWTRAPLMSR